MTVRELYSEVLMELVKEEAPALHLEEYNVYLRDSLEHVIDDTDAFFEANQRTTDWLAYLKKTVRYVKSDLVAGFYPNSWEMALPQDYRSFKGITVSYKILDKVPLLCLKKGDIFYPEKVAKLDADKYQSVVNLPFSQPSFKEPKYMFFGNKLVLLVGRNKLNGSINYFFEIDKVDIEYLANPPLFELTYAQLQTEADESQVLPFHQTFNRLLKERIILRLLERNGDPRQQSQPAASGFRPDPTIANIPRQ